MSRRIFGIFNPRPVIVRAYGGQPVRMGVIGSGRNFVEVAREGQSASIELPAANVFEFDAALFDLLRHTYEKRDVSALADLWATATPVGVKRVSA